MRLQAAGFRGLPFILSSFVSAARSQLVAVRVWTREAATMAWEGSDFVDVAQENIVEALGNTGAKQMGSQAMTCVLTQTMI